MALGVHHRDSMGNDCQAQEEIGKTTLNKNSQLSSSSCVDVRESIHL
jgi:hypothetical protein